LLFLFSFACLIFGVSDLFVSVFIFTLRTILGVLFVVFATIFLAVLCYDRGDETFLRVRKAVV